MAIGNFGIGGLRIPGAGNIDIEELVAQYKRAPTQSKKTKPKPKAKAKAKAKPKPKPKTPIRPNMRGGRFGLMEDSGLAPVPKKKAVAVKPKPQFKPKVTPRPSPVKIAARPKISSEDLMKVGPQEKGRASIPKINLSSVIPGANINIQEIIKQATQGGSTAPAQQTQTGSQETTKKKDDPFATQFEGSMDGTSDRDISEMTWEEINKEMNDIRFANRSTWDPSRRNNPLPERYQQLKAQYEAIAPISELEAAYDRLIGVPNAGEVYLKEGERLKKLIESRREGSQESQQSGSDDASTMKTLKEFFEKMKSQQKQQQPQQPQQPQMPQLPQVQQWDMMGQQQTGSMMPTPMSAVVKGPFMPSPMPPQMPSEMFGGYGGTAPIVPSMPYAGLGNFPQMARMQAPQYDPDAEPGGPPMPTGPVFT